MLVLELSLLRSEDSGTTTTYYYKALLQDSLRKVVESTDSIKIYNDKAVIFDPVSGKSY